MTARPQPWSVTAQNLPEHTENAIHTDAGAQASGFPRALVAGVTTYAYLTHPVVAAWGSDWLSSGGGEVRFRSPVFDQDIVRCTPRPETDAANGIESAFIDALCDDGPPRAVLHALRRGDAPADLRQGEALRTRNIRLDGRWADDYGIRAGDDLAVYTELGVVHPAVWPGLANHVVHTEVAQGPWIHTRSLIRHHALAPVGATVTVYAVIVERFQRTGERAILDVRFEIDGHPVATIEHEAIVHVAR